MTLGTEELTNTVSVYVRNAHEEIGGWVDLITCECFEEFQDKVAEVTGHASEVLILATETDLGISFADDAPLRLIWEVSEFLADLTDDKVEAFGDYLAYHGGYASYEWCSSTFKEAYQGQYESIEDFAWSCAEDLYGSDFPSIPGFRVEVDVIAWECDYWISGNGHVFRNM